MHIYYENKKILEIDSSSPKITNKNFIKSNQLAHHFFDESNRVPDVYRFDYSKKIIKVRDSIPDITNHNKRIVIILESPHKDEYKYFDECGNKIILPKRGNCSDIIQGAMKMEPVFPAMGTTGANLEKYLKEVIIPIIDEDKKYEVIICNPVPYQTSLFVLHGQSLTNSKKLKRNVWNALWSEEKIKCDFANRIVSYNPSIIVNCCTYLFKRKISKFLISLKLDTKLYESTHPSSWNNKKNRKSIIYGNN
ncbi:hypothetical protein [Heyndrickxia coagulans]|uniref:hypothetical protein n=1 Tax=Heyndrickxia coagulans TaxID=1398 RepID=UPI0015C6561F|nr:hypothetical protein [Heyndrickxia coagulans]